MYEPPDNDGGGTTLVQDGNKFIDSALLSAQPTHGMQGQRMQGGQRVNIDQAADSRDHKAPMTTGRGGDEMVDPRLSQNNWPEGLYHDGEDAFKDVRDES